MDDYDEEKRDSSYFNFGYGVNFSFLELNTKTKILFKEDGQDEEIVKNFQSFTGVGKKIDFESIKVSCES